MKGRISTELVWAISLGQVEKKYTSDHRFYGLELEDTFLGFY